MKGMPAITRPWKIWSKRRCSCLFKKEDKSKEVNKIEVWDHNKEKIIAREVDREEWVLHLLWLRKTRGIKGTKGTKRIINLFVHIIHNFIMVPKMKANQVNLSALSNKWKTWMWIQKMGIQY